MKPQLLVSVIIVLWSLLMRIVIKRLAMIASFFSDRIKDQLSVRPDVKADSIALAARRRQYDDCVIFFCSSAGEYEQAKPIIDAIMARGNILCHVFFFSSSGRTFLESRKEDVSWSVAPLDDAFHWGSLFAALRPSRSVVIRHELWPAFLWIASQWGEIIVVNAVTPSLFGRQAKWKDDLNLLIKGWLFRFVNWVCAVSQSDREFFERWLQIDSRTIFVTGDTKYDRVIARCRQKAEHSIKLKQYFREEWVVPGCDRLLIAGSVHLPDVNLILEALKCPELQRIKVLLVPHDISSSHIAKIFDAVKSDQVKCELLSEVENKGYHLDVETPRVIIADEMGRLSDLYSVADLSWVGGAVHAKIHNVLEPGIWGLPISCGENFANSQEAILLHKTGLLFASNDPLVVRAQWVKLMDEYQTVGKQTQTLVESLGGATQTIINKIFLLDRASVCKVSG